VTEKLLWAASPVHVWWTHGLGKGLLRLLLAALSHLGSAGSESDPVPSEQLLS